MTEADLTSLAPALILAGSAAITALLASTRRVGVRALGWFGAAVSIAAATTAVAIGPAAGSAGTVVRDGASLFFITSAQTGSDVFGLGVRACTTRAWFSPTTAFCTRSKGFRN